MTTETTKMGEWRKRCEGLAMLRAELSAMNATGAMQRLKLARSYLLCADAESGMEQQIPDGACIALAVEQLNFVLADFRAFSGPMQRDRLKSLEDKFTDIVGRIQSMTGAVSLLDGPSGYSSDS